MTSLRKSLSETSAPRPAPKFQPLFAHCSKSLSCVTPRSSVMASNLLRPGDLRPVLGSPPSRCSTTSVVRLSALTLLMPATYRPSHFSRNLKFLYGSNRWVLTLNCAIPVLPPVRALASSASGLDLAGDLLDLDHDELSRLERREPDEDVHDAAVHVILCRCLLVAFHEVRVAWGLAGKGALAKQTVHERADVEANLRPQRFVVRFEHHPLGAAI